MSHFLAMVILPRNTKSIDSAIEKLLAPYDENQRVDEYPHECHCRIGKAREAASKAADEKFGTIDELRKSFPDWAKKNNPEVAAELEKDELAQFTSDVVDKAWKDYVRSYSEYEQAVYQKELQHATPDPECEECGGKGYILSRYPLNVWEWIDGKGRKMGVTKGEEVLPYLLQTPIVNKFSSSEETSRRSVQLLQKLHEEEEQSSNARTTASLASQSEVPNNSSDVRGNVTEPTGSVCNLSDSSDEKTFSSRPQSYDRSDKDVALHKMQRSSGSSPGQSGDSTENDSLPPDSFCPPFTKYLISGAKWDWYQIGGRFTGFLAEVYDPAKDPANIETCFLCNGSGKRDDIPVWDDKGPFGGGEPIGYERGTCNACEGTGKRLKWPTQWRRFKNDVSTVLRWKSLFNKNPKNYMPFAIVTPDGRWWQQAEMGWFGMTADDKDPDLWEHQVRNIIEEYVDHPVVVCDLHI